MKAEMRLFRFRDTCFVWHTQVFFYTIRACNDVTVVYARRTPIAFRSQL